VEDQVEPPVAGLSYGGAGKYFGTCTYRFVLNGFFLEARVEDNNPGGKTSGIRMTGYDATAKNYVEDAYDSEGSRSVGTAALEGETWTVTSTLATPGGKKVLTRVVRKYAPDWSGCTTVFEVSPDDGKTWKLWSKEQARKVKK